VCGFRYTEFPTNYLGFIFPALLHDKEMQHFSIFISIFFVYNLSRNKYVYNLQHFLPSLKSFRSSSGYVLKCLTFNYSKHSVVIISYADAVIIFATIYTAVIKIRFINIVSHDVENTHFCQHLFTRALVAT